MQPLRLTPKQALLKDMTLSGDQIDIVCEGRTLSKTSSLANRVKRWMGGGSMMSVQRKSSAPQRRCYLNVQDHCLVHGGSIATGWKMMIVPQAYVFAIHHAVWQMESGTLLDITAPDEGDTSNFTTFIIDTAPLPIFGIREEAGLIWAKGLPGKFMALSASQFSATLTERHRVAAEQHHREAFVPVYPQFATQLVGAPISFATPLARATRAAALAAHAHGIVQIDVDATGHSTTGRYMAGAEI